MGTRTDTRVERDPSFKMNLGPFSDRIERLGEDWDTGVQLRGQVEQRGCHKHTTLEASAETNEACRYAPPAGAFYYRDRNTMESDADAGGTGRIVSVPFFDFRDVGGPGFGSECRVGLDRLISRVEFGVITMVYDLARRFGVELLLDKVGIPVRSELCGFLPDGRPWAEVSLGIVIFTTRLALPGEANG